ncbi:MAG TPA: UDP-N-acetylmuramoyl-tripeptide--D-alanyl-D-alanine ligase [Burkholderiales bacterium]|nr:UDP-N-acetylmuramoyl-tripeptide--D-alanyl-D-alanine ligase [Burkholderiales bacterium]
MLTLAQAARALGATVIGADVSFESVSTDSRTIERGALFVALHGERLDGHEYVGAARERGAAAAMVERVAGVSAQAAGLPLLVVGDAKLALGALAKYWRGRFRIPVIGVVGSNGKTTVKEMLAAALSEQFGATRVLATAGNLNNDIGLPLTCLRLRDAHACAVIEIGMNHPGETGYLAGIAQPTVALINNAHREHQEFMKSVDEVAAEHAALVRALTRDGVAVLNRDDPHFDFWREIAGARRVRDFGLRADATVRAVVRSSGIATEFELVSDAGSAAATLHAPGVHNVRNAVATAAAATAVGASLDAVARGLAAFRPVKGRLQPKPGRDGIVVIDDSYNANPDSVRAAIDVLAGSERPRVLVLGDMGEVGVQGEAFHEEVGRYAKEAGVDRLIAVGTLARSAARAFGAGGEHLDSIEAVIARAQGLTALKGTILVKGSRFMRMERVVEHLVAEKDAGCC